VAREADLDSTFLRQVLLALGRPNPRRGERAFTDADVEEARILKAFVGAGLPRKDIVGIARILGNGMANTAVAIREVVGNAFLQRGDTEHDLAFRYAQAAEELGPLLGPMLGNELMAHLRDVIRREAVTQAERESGSIRGTREVGVGFADLVGFTQLGRESQAEELGRVAGRLSDSATRLASPPVQVVKTIGDAVMLASTDVAKLLDALVALLRAWQKQGPDSLQLRAGIAYGPAVTRGGDWFGAPVNLASRLTDSAKPGTIHVAAEAQEEVGDRYDWPRRRRKSLKGVGRAAYFRLAPESG
jgi:adenylate cyclase